jgi:1,4-alpha-glucan branching enzyme
MKHDQDLQQAMSAAPQSLPVRFEFTDTSAVSVFVAGTFNNWQPDAKPMYPVGNHRWVRETVLPIGIYEYCLVVDGEFRPDPMAMETVPNLFGGRNSVLKVASSLGPDHLAEAEFLPLKDSNHKKI